MKGSDFHERHYLLSYKRDSGSSVEETAGSIMEAISGLSGAYRRAEWPHQMASPMTATSATSSPMAVSLP